MKHAAIDLERQSPQVQSAAAFLRGTVPSAEFERSLELAGILAQLQADDELLLAGLLVPCFGSIQAPPERVAELVGEPALRLVR